MKNKKGFISVSIIYSFFLVFLLIMLAMLATYINKAYLVKKIGNTPIDNLECNPCENDSLAVCLKKMENVDKYCKGVPVPEDEQPNNNPKCQIVDGKYYDKKGAVVNNKASYEASCLVKADDPCVKDSESGLIQTTDDGLNYSYVYTGNVKNNYVSFAGFIWRIVRINGDGSIRLIYAGEASNNKLKKGTNAYITVENVFEEYVKENKEKENARKGWKNINVSKTRYNYFWILNELQKGGCQTIQMGVQNTINNLADNINVAVVSNWNKYQSNTVLKDTINQFGLSGILEKVNKKATDKLTESGNASIVDREWALKCLAASVCSDGNISADGTCSSTNKDKFISTWNNIAGGEFLWNIGYMNNHSHLEEYDSIFDNQDDSEVKMWVDKWYEQNLSSYSDDIDSKQIFCGDKNLESGSNNRDYEWKYDDTKVTTKYDTFNKIVNWDIGIAAEANSWSLNTIQGKFTFSGYNRLGSSEKTNQLKLTINGKEYSTNKFTVYPKKNGTGASLICKKTGDAALLDGSTNFLGNKVINLSNYSVGDNPTLLYEHRAYCQENEDFANNIKQCVSNANPVTATINIFKFGWEKGYEKTKNDYQENCNVKDMLYYQCSPTDEKATYYYNDNTFTATIDAIGEPGFEKEPKTPQGNGQLKYPIGLLSADEAVYAGARLEKHKENSSSTTYDDTTACPTYLDQDMNAVGETTVTVDSNKQILDKGGSWQFWTMTLAFTDVFLGNGADYYVITGKNGGTVLDLKNDTSIGSTSDKTGAHSAGAYMRPVINIKNIASGEFCANGPTAGTKDNPYIIGVACDD